MRPSDIIVFRRLHPNPMDPAQRTIALALRDYRADAQRCLLGLAHALARTGRTDPAAAEPPGDAPLIDAPLADAPLAVPETLALPDPGGWPGALAQLLDGPSARRIGDLGLDVGVFALLEVRRLEQAEVGPAAGILRRQGPPSPAWQHLCEAAAARARVSLGTRVAMQRERHGLRLSVAMQRDLNALYDALADEGVPLVRLAAAHARPAGAFTSHLPAPVRGAPGWEVHLRIEPTVDGAWLVTAQRIWAGIGPAPQAPAIALTLHTGHGRSARAVHHRIDDEDAFTLWYEDRPPGPAPRLSARRDEGPAGA